MQDLCAQKLHAHSKRAHLKSLIWGQLEERTDLRTVNVAYT